MDGGDLDGEVDVHDLPRWSDEVDEEDDEFDEDEDEFDVAGGASDGVSYPINHEANYKMVLWQGNITQLNVDAIVNNTNDSMSDRTEVSGLIFDVAGHELEQECRKIGSCRPGEAKDTTSGKIARRGGAKHVIHTVPPEWKEDGSENLEITLEKCYKSVIALAKKRKFKSLAFCVLKRKDYPRERAAHICCKTLRKVLESTSNLSMVVLVFRQNDVYDQMIYEIVLPLYFPRNAQEVLDSKEHLTKYEQAWAVDRLTASQASSSAAALAQATKDAEAAAASAATKIVREMDECSMGGPRVFINPELIDRFVTGLGQAGRDTRTFEKSLEPAYVLRSMPTRGAVSRTWPRPFSVWEEDPDTADGYSLLTCMDSMPTEDELDVIFDGEQAVEAGKSGLDGVLDGLASFVRGLQSL